MRTWRHGAVGGALAVALLLGLTLAGAVMSARELDGREREQVGRRADEAAAALSARMSAYEEVLYGVRGLFMTAGPVSSAGFRRHVESLDLERRYPGIQVVGLAEPAAPAGRARRPLRVSSLEPLAGNEASLGLDFLSEPRRRASVLRSLASGATSATAPLRLVQEPGNQPGFLIHLAVPRRGAAPPLAPGDAVGVVFAAFRMGDLLGGLFSEAAGDGDIDVYDAGPWTGAAPARPAATFALDGRPGAWGEMGGGAQRRDVAVGGRRWAVVYRPGGSPLSAAERATPWVIGAGGAALTGLAGWLLWALATSRRRVQELAERMTEDLRASEARFREVIERAPDAMLVVDSGGRVVLVNERLERLFGYDRDELAGRPMEILLPESLRELHERHRAGYATRPAARAMGAGLELSGRRRDGSTFPVDVALSPLRSTSGLLVAAAIRDVTERRALERAKDEFIAVASHELRTPLTSVLGYIEVLLEGHGGQLSPEQRRLAEVARRNGERLGLLVGDVLLVAQADAGRLALRLAPADLGALAREHVEGARPQAAEAGIALGLMEEAGVVVAADRARLGQVLDNLLSNALKFTGAGGEVEVRVRSAGGRAVLEVADTGPGIAPADQPHVFERFYRTEAAARDAVPGTGLGLAICRMIVEAHEGTIAVESEPGRGATFRVELPPRHDAPRPAAALARAAG